MRDGLLDVLVITEGAPFDAEPLLAVFEADPGVQWMQAKQPRAQQFFNSRIADLWDAYVLYDRPGIEFRDGADPTLEVPTRDVTRGFDDLCDAGHGFVVVHQALGGWPAWPGYADALAAAFLHAPGEFAQQQWPPSGYRPQTWHNVSPVDPAHPLVAGLDGGFSITDELFLFPIDERRITPIMRSDFEFVSENFSSAGLRAHGREGRRDGWQHPAGSNVMVWTTRYRNAELVCVQCGSGPAALGNPGLRRLLANAVRWVARHRHGGPAIPYESGE